MPKTHGFEIVSQVTVQLLREILNAAWKSADDSSGEGVIPEKFEIPAGLNMGPYTVKEGTVQIPKEELDLNMATDVNGVAIKLGTIIHIEIDNPPIPSATFFDITADVTVKTPVVTLEGDKNVGVRLENLPPNAVVASITSGDPIGPITSGMVEEYVHEKLRHDPSFPTVYDNIPIAFPPFSMTGRLELYDDESDPAKRASASFPEANKVLVSIPCYMRFYNISGEFAGVSLQTPMGITGTIEMLADYTTAGNQVIAKLSEADVELTNVQPAPGVEGTNYTHNANLVSIASFSLEDIIKNNFALLAQTELTKIGDVQQTVPSVNDIEGFIVQEIRKELDQRKQILIWEPEVPEDAEVDFAINDVTPQALNEGLAIAINDTGSGNSAAITYFVPINRDFASAVSKDEVIEKLESARFKTFGNLPTRLEDPVEGHDVDLNELEFSLKTGAIKAEGEVTVIDAIAGSIDVDADFSADIGMEWQDNPDGSQKIHPFVIGEPDVDFSLLLWILSFLFAFITAGIVGGIIVVVVLAIAEGLAERIGGAIIRDEVTDQVTGIGAWPQSLTNIGTISARFENPIGIDSDGILFAGTMLITSMHALTSEDFARSGGPYQNTGGQALQFDGGSEKETSEIYWDFDDGNASIIRKPTHIYGKSGLYIAKLRVAVNEDGGVTTRHFAAVKVKNVVPQIQMPPTITANEGEVIQVVAQFTDANWLDTHTATIDWGDNAPPEDVVVHETNNKPLAQGEVIACHAYCDNGTYEVKLTVRDDVGGIGIGTMTIQIENVAPEVFLPDTLYTLQGQCVHLLGAFEDAGWCDTHTGEWDLGDCSRRDAFIVQTNEKPKAIGTAEVRHVYQNCGIFRAQLTITDDDGGVGMDHMNVHVNHLKNGTFEEGFYRLAIREGHTDQIANHWLPYAMTVDTVEREAMNGQRKVDFDPQQFLISQGQRSQRIQITGAMHAGILQQLDVNSGWDYEFTGQFHVPNPSHAKAVIGIDPLGGTDPESTAIIWREVDLGLQWKNATVRATARGQRITLFIGLLHRSHRSTEIYWDACSLYQIQPYCNEIPCEPVCINFSDLKPDVSIKKSFQFEGLLFIPGKQGIFTTQIGDPDEQVKLGFHSDGVRIEFPDFVDYVKLTITNHAGRIIEIVTLYEEEPLSVRQEIISNETKTIELEEPEMNGVLLRGGKSEAALVEICLCIPNDSEAFKGTKDITKNDDIREKNVKTRNVFQNIFEQRNK